MQDCTIARMANHDAPLCVLEIYQLIVNIVLGSLTLEEELNKASLQAHDHGQLKMPCANYIYVHLQVMRPTQDPQP